MRNPNGKKSGNLLLTFAIIIFIISIFVPITLAYSTQNKKIDNNGLDEEYIKVIRERAAFDNLEGAFEKLKRLDRQLKLTQLKTMAVYQRIYIC